MNTLIKRYRKALLIIALIITPSFSFAVLEASVDQRTITEGGSVSLTVRNTDTGTPDFNILKQDFIISNQRIANIENEYNGKRIIFTQWQFTLSPKNTGKIIIPSIKANNQSTTPIEINVLPLSGAAKAQLKQAYFFDVKASSDKAIIGQEVVISMTIYAESQIGGSINIPELNGKKLESLSEMAQSQSFYNGKNYYTHTQQFRLIAEDIGPLTIEPFSLDGSIQISYNRQKNFRIQSEPLTIEVKDIPEEFPDTYELLIAKDLTMTWEYEQLSTQNQTKPINEIEAGESINLILDISASGIQSERIPDFKRLLQTQGFKQYPDNSKFENTAKGNHRLETIGLVATGQNPATISGFKFPWWDLNSETVKWVELPSREFSVKTPVNYTQNTNASGLNEEDFKLAVDEAVAKALSEAAPSDYSAETSSVWKYTAIAALVGWLLTVLAFIFVIKKQASTSNKDPKIKENSWQSLFKQGQKESNSHKIRQALLQWATLESGRTVISLHQVSAMIKDSSIQQSLEAMINSGFDDLDFNALSPIFEYLNQVQTVVADIPEVIIK
jgi:hypothetical protein